MAQDEQKEITALFFRIKYAEEKIGQFRSNKKGYEAARCDEWIKYHEDMVEVLRQEIINLGATEELLANLEQFYKENELFRYLNDYEQYNTIA